MTARKSLCLTQFEQCLIEGGTCRIGFADATCAREFQPRSS